MHAIASSRAAALPNWKMPPTYMLLAYIHIIYIVLLSSLCGAYKAAGENSRRSQFMGIFSMCARWPNAQKKYVFRDCMPSWC